MKVQSITNHGSIIVFEFDEEGTQWVDHNVATEGWQWMGNFRLAVDHRNALPFSEVLASSGFDMPADHD